MPLKFPLVQTIIVRQVSSDLEEQRGKRERTVDSTWKRSLSDADVAAPRRDTSGGPIFFRLDSSGRINYLLRCCPSRCGERAAGDGPYGGLKATEHRKSVGKYESRAPLGERVATMSIPLAAAVRVPPHSRRLFITRTRSGRELDEAAVNVE